MTASAWAYAPRCLPAFLAHASRCCWCCQTVPDNVAKPGPCDADKCWDIISVFTTTASGLERGAAVLRAWRTNRLKQSQEQAEAEADAGNAEFVEAFERIRGQERRVELPDLKRLARWFSSHVGALLREHRERKGARLVRWADSAAGDAQSGAGAVAELGRLASSAGLRPVRVMAVLCRSDVRVAGGGGRGVVSGGAGVPVVRGGGGLRG